MELSSLVYCNSTPGFPFLSKINLVQKLISEAQRPGHEVNHVWPVPKLRMNCAELPLSMCFRST